MRRWVEIRGYDNYIINEMGDIINKDKNIELKQNIMTNGYVYVALSKNGESKKFILHRLVAIAFIQNPEKKKCVNHIDGNKQNNCVSNLEWCTYKENTQHAFRTGLICRKKKVNINK